MDEASRDDDCLTLDCPAPPVIPPEIAFLGLHGVAPADLVRAAEAASIWNVSADRALLALSILSEDEFYRALAQHLGVPFAPTGMKAEDVPAIAAVMATGMLRVVAAGPGRRVALAPEGAALRRLIERPGRILPSIVIGTPALLRRLAREAAADRVARAAADALPERAPHLSAKGGMNRWQTVMLGIAVPIIGAAIASWQAQALSWLMLAATVPFLGVVVLRLAAIRDRHGTTMPLTRAFAIPSADLPVYTVLVALYREREILSQTIRALRALDYPPAKLDVKLLIEADDADTRDALAAFDLPAHIEVLIVPPGEPRTKPRALNAGLIEARGTFLVVYDAEDVPDPLQLRYAAAALAAHGPEVGCLQGRLVIDNTEDSWLTRLFTLEYAQLFDVLNPMLAAMGLAVPLGGTSTHFRTEALRRVGGWDAWNVTEDADLGLRLAAFGYRTADLASATVEEAPATLRAWLAQRTRWFKGWLQVSITFSRMPHRTLRRMGLRPWFWAGILVFGTILTALWFPFLTLAALVAGWQIARGNDDGWAVAVVSLSAVVFVTGLIAIVAPAWEGARRRRLNAGPLRLLALVPYHCLMSIAAWRALIELVRAPTRWNKTPHGLAKTSRTGALTIKQANPVRSAPADA